MKTTLALVLALGTLTAFAAAPVVYSTQTDLAVTRVELKSNNNGSAWIELDLQDGDVPEGGFTYQTSKKITVPGLSYDASRKDFIYNGAILATKKFFGAKVAPQFELSAKSVTKTSYVKDTEGNEHALSSVKFVQVRFGNK
jgi:hypothetical protein